MSEMTVRECLYGHQMVWPAQVLPKNPAHVVTECSCGWLDGGATSQLEAYARYIWHLSERMYAAIALMDAAHREDAFEQGDGLVILRDSPPETS